MTDITAFVRARLDEVEEDARDAYYDGQMWVPEEELVVAADRELDPVLFLDRKRDAQHAANWSPARVLAQVAAMRRMLDLRYSWALQIDKAPEQVRHVFEAQVIAADTMLRSLAAIWRDHDQYDPAWAPEGE